MLHVLSIHRRMNVHCMLYVFGTLPKRHSRILDQESAIAVIATRHRSVYLPGLHGKQGLPVPWIHDVSTLASMRLHRYCSEYSSIRRLHVPPTSIGVFSTSLSVRYISGPVNQYTVYAFVDSTSPTPKMEKVERENCSKWLVSFAINTYLMLRVIA